MSSLLDSPSDVIRLYDNETLGRRYARFRRATFYSHLTCKVGNILTKTSELRTNLKHTSKKSVTYCFNVSLTFLSPRIEFFFWLSLPWLYLFAMHKQIFELSTTMPYHVSLALAFCWLWFIVDQTGLIWIWSDLAEPFQIWSWSGWTLPVFRVLFARGTAGSPRVERFVQGEANMSVSS